MQNKRNIGGCFSSIQNLEMTYFWFFKKKPPEKTSHVIVMYPGGSQWVEQTNVSEAKTGHRAVLGSIPQSCLTLWPHGLPPTRLLCPRHFPSKNTGVGCHLLLQGIFLTQGLNSCLLHWQAGTSPLSHQGSPRQDTTRVPTKRDAAHGKSQGPRHRAGNTARL